MPDYDEASVLEVLDKVSRSVVNVSTVKLLQRIFYRAVPVKGMGSGTIIDPEGQILTNNMHACIVDRSQVEQSQIHQLTTALKHQMLKEIRESQSKKSINSCLGVGSPGEIRTPV